ncbi:nadh-ubiquinone oxidoreductase b22 subunit [Holotrichia oblita]|uniref:Nadh-ubiquinone oxidoreductase b22 subunit n=3 Tax=Holotrichia oblita TaxID=644536 RepID=A0ACB9TQ70_HOLOL|nr:nadh-ubiquinone oxidoreductase b22 subunit [Holotrichia oblita]KAI4469027.1 nadh-ubiquinone oxidoreductase b22 subunit [Holotrichia oblita]KAI4469046.1 nadh-ubiquinone oxidoreductase b22 subunit [Holotrichia oblita]
MASLPTGLVSHTRRVQSLYKKALRCLESWYDRREVYRYHAVLMRKRFDENKDIRDMRVAKDLIAQGEEEVFQKNHWHPRKFPESPGGVAYERVVIPPDWMVDHWHPLEKAQYPTYFAKREELKKKFVDEWTKKYGKPSPIAH